MKKMISLILCGALLAGLSACGSGEKNTSDSSSSAISSEESKENHSVDVLAYAGQGVIPELEVGLGTYIGTVKELYHYAESEPEGEEGEESYGITIYDTYTQVKADVGDAYFFYKTKYEGKGISKIVYFEDAFDFNIGITMSDDVKGAIQANPTTDEDVKSVDFLPATPDNFHRISYDVNDRTIDFYFADDFLSCIVLTDNRYWVED